MANENSPLRDEGNKGKRLNQKFEYREQKEVSNKFGLP